MAIQKRNIITTLASLTSANGTAREGAVLSMGVFIGASTKVVDRHTGEIHIGTVPPYAVVVPGTLPGGANKPSLYCAVIVKTVDEQTRAKTSINDLLRD